jgi:hypothetical protein
MLIYQSQGPPGMFGWYTFNEHVRLGRDNRGVDEAKEEESTNEGTNSDIRCLRVFTLFKKSRSAPFSSEGSRPPYPCQTSNLFADPPYTVRHRFHTIDNGQQECVGNLHQHGQPRSNDLLNVRIGGCFFGSHTTREIRWEATRLFFDLGDHLFVDL